MTRFHRQTSQGTNVLGVEHARRERLGHQAIGHFKVRQIRHVLKRRRARIRWRNRSTRDNESTIFGSGSRHERHHTADTRVVRHARGSEGSVLINVVKAGKERSAMLTGRFHGQVFDLCLEVFQQRLEVFHLPGLFQSSTMIFCARASSASLAASLAFSASLAASLASLARLAISPATLSWGKVLSTSRTC
jgi:hypothetical protein